MISLTDTTSRCNRHADYFPDMTSIQRDWVAAGSPGANRKPSTSTMTSSSQRTPAEEFSSSIKRSKDDGFGLVNFNLKLIRARVA